MASGCLSIHVATEDEGGVAVHHESSKLSTVRTGKALYAHSAMSLPPLEAVFRYGSGAVKKWLTKIGWKAEWGWNGNFPAPEVADAYAAAQRINLPLDGASVFAVLGGWHTEWDRDWRLSTGKSTSVQRPIMPIMFTRTPVIALKRQASSPMHEIVGGDPFRPCGVRV